jgi:single-strand DNA-binding protein
MASFNQVTLIGNLTRDPQQKFLQSGTAVCEFGLAVNSSYTNKSGQKVEECSFFEVTFFGKIAEVCGQYLTKGKQILVSGKLKQETWDDKETGAKRSKVKVIGESMVMLGGKSGENGNRRSESTEEGGSSGGSSEPASDYSNSDDVPF